MPDDKIDDVATRTFTKPALAFLLDVDDATAQGLIALGRGLGLIEPCGAEKRDDGRRGANLYAIREDIVDRLAEKLRKVFP